MRAPCASPGSEARMTGYRSMQFRTLLLYAQDARGLGHITRTLNIARHVLAAQPDAVAFIATRSNFAHHSTLPERCDYIKLPSRQTPKTVERTPEDDEASKAHFRQLRGQILLDAALGLAPDLVLVDHEPLGASGEFARGLWALKEQCPDTRFVFGLRDIMDDVERIRAEWRQYGVYEALEHLYDGIAVYGSPRLLDVAEAYAIPEHVRRKLHYCGYIVRDPPTVDPCEVRGRHGVPENVPFVLPEEQAALQARATATCRVVSYADNFQLMTAADAIVSMGGYNSVCEALVAARPLVIVPRATHKVEQRIRAETLAAHGLAR